MDILKMTERRHDCIADSPPACQYTCPLDIDIRDFIKKIQDGLISAAFKTLKTNAVFPGITCHLCSEPCKDVCVRKDVDSSISIRDLEWYCWKQENEKPRRSHYIPSKNKKILIKGGSLAGCTCGIKLAQRGYDVVIIESSDRLGGRIWEEAGKKITEDVINSELQTLIDHKFVTVKLVECLETFSQDGYEVVLDARALQDKDHMRSIREGVELSYHVESYIKTGKSDDRRNFHNEQKYFPDPKKIEIMPEDTDTPVHEWTLENAEKEAERCIMCTCRECIDVCEMMTYYQKTAKQLISNVNDTVNKTRINKNTAVKPIMSCTQCGSCREVCPVDIDLKTLCMDTRRFLHKRDKLPDAHYDYWINDMIHSNSRSSSVFIKNKEKIKYLYFPGCQMGASNHKYVKDSYKWLCNELDKVGIFMGCCGAPAFWAVKDDMHKEILDKINSLWEENDHPVFLLACPTCQEMFRDHLDYITVNSLWDIMAQRFQPIEKNMKTVSVFDPCTSKYTDQTHRSIRRLLDIRGYEVSELPYDVESIPCCGYGGLINPYNKDLTRIIGEHNSSLGENEFITYCVNCQDSFIIQGKQSRYIMDVLFNEGEQLPPSPDLSERRSNREMLHDDLTGEKKLKDSSSDKNIKLVITGEMFEYMENNLILEDNIRKVIMHAEDSGLCSYNEKDGSYTSYLRQGHVTFWVKYTKHEDRFIIERVYTHRMRIEGD